MGKGCLVIKTDDGKVIVYSDERMNEGIEALSDILGISFSWGGEDNLFEAARLECENGALESGLEMCEVGELYS